MVSNYKICLVAATYSCFIVHAIIPERAFAAEGGTETYLLGSRDSMAGALPPPGTYMSNDFQFYSATAPSISVGGVVVVLPQLNTKVYKGGITHVTDHQVFGASLGFNVTVPIAYGSMDVGGGIPGFLTGNLSDSQFGMGDIVVSPILGWHSGKLHTSLSASFYLPVGNYDTATIDVPNRTIDVLSIGKNRFAFDPTLSVTYLDPDTGFELTGAVGVTFSAINKATDYQTAPEFHFEGTLAQHLSSGWVVRLTGYAYQQLDDDSGTGAAAARAQTGALSLKSRVFGLGPIITYSTKIGDHPVSFKAKYIKEFHSRRRFEGERFWFGAGFPF